MPVNLLEQPKRELHVCPKKSGRRLIDLEFKFKHGDHAWVAWVDLQARGASENTELELKSDSTQFQHEINTNSTFEMVQKVLNCPREEGSLPRRNTNGWPSVNYFADCGNRCASMAKVMADRKFELHFSVYLISGAGPNKSGNSAVYSSLAEWQSVCRQNVDFQLGLKCRQICWFRVDLLSE